MSALATPSSGKLSVRLYLAGEGPNSVAAAANLRRVLARHPELAVELEIIDVLLDPQRAASDGVFVTPLMIKLAPAPERRVLGNLRDQAILLGALGIQEAPHE